MIAAPTLALALLATTPALADSLSCQVTTTCDGPTACAAAPLLISFAIDRNQFTPPIHSGEPPSRKVTRVTLGHRAFQAEPILMDSGVRGFWTDDADNGAQVLTIRRDGTAIYSAPDGKIWTGTCKDDG